MITLKDKTARQEIEMLHERIRELESRTDYYGPEKSATLLFGEYSNSTLTAREIITRFNELYEYLGIERNKIPAREVLQKKAKATK